MRGLRWEAFIACRGRSGKLAGSPAEGRVVGRGDYASVSGYVRDLIRRDRARRDEGLALNDLRKLVSDARASGIGNRSVEDIFEAARQGKWALSPHQSSRPRSFRHFCLRHPPSRFETGACEGGRSHAKVWRRGYKEAGCAWQDKAKGRQMLITQCARCKRGICNSRMIDLSETDDSGDGASISASVGEGGANKKPDVLTIQQLLNAVAVPDGGPRERLDEDGLCGPRTKAAILRFQQAHVPQLLADGRVDPEKNTLKMLRLLAGGNARANPAITAAAPVASQIPEATQILFAGYLYLSRWRVYEAIQCIDLARGELDLLNIRSFMLPRMTFMEAYVDGLANAPQKVTETNQIDRCFKFLRKDKSNLDMKTSYGHAIGALSKMRTVYTTMLDVIIGNSITTPEDEKTGKRRFLRVVPQSVLDRAHPEYHTNEVLADATLGGWNAKDARRGRIRYGSAHIEASGSFTTLIHEMAHFVSSQSTFMIGDHGYYHKAFQASPYLAIRNAESYAWYALLAQRKQLRSLPDDQLPTDL